MTDLPFHVPDYIRSLSPYIPGKPIEETQREFKIKRVVKLASNENPLGPSPKALAAARAALKETHRYPDGSAFALKAVLSKHLKTPTDSLIIGNGSNEIIEFLIRTFCVPGDSIVTSQSAFIVYKLCAQIHGVSTIETPATADLRFDLDAILSAVRAQERVKMVFIANPNNPTGTHVTTSELRSFLKDLGQVRGGSVMAALDYAYWEYVTAGDLPDPMELQREFPQVVVLRTFSKIYGLAGFRVGYGVAPARVIASLEKVRQPFNINSPGLAAARAAIGDQRFVAMAKRINKRGMAFWEKTLGDLSIPYWPSQGNFLLADVQRGTRRSGPELYQACLRKGAVFRPLANYGMPGALRISIGTPEENLFAARKLKEVLG